MPANTMTAILEWIEEFKCNTHVTIKKTSLADSNYWFYDNLHGEIRNQTNRFFKIKGFYTENSTHGFALRLIILFKRDGHLGDLRCAINGELHFILMKAKMKRHIYKIQVALQLQATRSTLLKKHGGNKPAYFDYF
jgi:hypothetical protein